MAHLKAKERLQAMRLAGRLASEAGRFLKRGQSRIRRIDYKGASNNLVTDMDRASERRIVRALRRAYPDHDIVGEEEARRLTGSPFRWHIDPLDGTTNYAHGLPLFAVSIALEVDGRVEAGAVCSPVLGYLFEARRGGGARLNGKRIRVSGAPSLKRSLLATGFPYRYSGKKKNLKYFDRFMKTARAIRRWGVASLDLCLLAMGSFDGFWEFDLGSWDIAAGILIVEEAGGRTTDFSGKPVRLERGELCATNGRIHREMLEKLK